MPSNIGKWRESLLSRLTTDTFTMTATTHQLLLLLLSLHTLPTEPFFALTTLQHSSSSSSLPSSSLQSTAYGYHGYQQPIDIDESSPRDIVTFQNTWAPAYGIQTSPSFALSSSSQSSSEYGPSAADVYAVTTDDVPAGTTVLYVPEELILSSNKAMAELRTADMNQAEKVLCSINAEGELRQYYLMIKVREMYKIYRCCHLWSISKYMS